MDVSTLKNQIKTKDLQSFYIFTGEEWKVQQLYIEQMAKTSGKQKKYIEGVEQIFSKLKGNSFIKQSFVYILRDDKTLLNDEKVQERLPAVLDGNILILLLTTVDKRTKFYKKYSDGIVVFEQLKPAMLKKYIQKEICLSDHNCETLMKVCEYDYGRCLLEIDKIKNWILGYGEDKQELMTENGALLRLINDGAIYIPPYDAIFDFVDAVLRGQVRKAFELLYQSYAVGEATMVLLSVLYNNAKQVLQIQTCSGKDVSRVTGLTSWQIKHAKERTGYYSNEELMDMMALIQKCETGIKSGTMEENVAVEYIMINIM